MSISQDIFYTVLTKYTLILQYFLKFNINLIHNEYASQLRETKLQKYMFTFTSICISQNG